MTQLITSRGRSFIDANLGNLIRNASFVDDVEGWYSVDSFGHSATTRTPGSGSLTHTKGSGNTSIYYRPGGPIFVPLNGLTTLDIAGYARSANTTGHALIIVEFYSGPTNDLFLSDVRAPNSTGTQVNDDGWTLVTLTDIAVPESATHISIRLRATGMDGNPVLWDDLYVGPTRSGFPDAAIPFLDNRIPNGDFETTVADWRMNQQNETITRETGAPITGTGSLKCVCPGDFGDEGVRSDSDEIVVEAGEAIRVQFRIKGAGEITAMIDYNNAIPEDNVLWTGTVTGTPQLVSADAVVPAGAKTAVLHVRTTTAQAVTFYLDDVSLGTPT